MSEKNEIYTPNYAVLPGDHIAELLEMHGMSQKELAERAGVTPKHNNTIIKGGARITPEFARSLGILFDYPTRSFIATSHKEAMLIYSSCLSSSNMDLAFVESFSCSLMNQRTACVSNKTLIPCTP